MALFEFFPRKNVLAIFPFWHQQYSYIHCVFALISNNIYDLHIELNTRVVRSHLRMIIMIFKSCIAMILHKNIFRSVTRVSLQIVSCQLANLPFCKLLVNLVFVYNFLLSLLRLLYLAHFIRDPFQKFHRQLKDLRD